MNEKKRQAFLAAMDIQPYFPRRVLLGAKPSPVYEFPDNDPIVASTGEASTAPVGQARAKPTSRAKMQGLDAIDELRAATTTARKASVTPIRKETPTQAPTDGDSNAEIEAEGGLSFTLRYFRPGGSLALLAEAPRQGSEQLGRESQKLMLAILRALGMEPSEEGPRAEEFSWPLQSGYSSKHSPQEEAAKALSGFLQMRQETDGFTDLLVFADQLEDLLLGSDRAGAERDFKSKKGYSITVTHSLASMLAVATLKRDVWQHLQPLRRRLANSNR